MKTLELNGCTTLLDDEDFARFAGKRWFVVGISGKRRYARRQERIDGRKVTVYLHRLILGTAPGLDVDHINGDTLDNRRANLREVTRSQNNQNTRAARADSASGVKNVRKCRSGRYEVVVAVGGKRYGFGRHDDLATARRVAAAARELLHTHAPVGLL